MRRVPDPTSALTMIPASASSTPAVVFTVTIGIDKKITPLFVLVIRHVSESAAGFEPVGCTRSVYALSHADSAMTAAVSDNTPLLP